MFNTIRKVVFNSTNNGVWSVFYVINSILLVLFWPFITEIHGGFLEILYFGQNLKLFGSKKVKLKFCWVKKVFPGQNRYFEVIQSGFSWLSMWWNRFFLSFKKLCLQLVFNRISSIVQLLYTIIVQCYCNRPSEVGIV